MKEGDIYRHYNSLKFYKIIGVGINTETKEEVVVYRGVYWDSKYPDNPIFVKPKSRFLEEIEYDDGTTDTKFYETSLPYHNSDSSSD